MYLANMSRHNDQKIGDVLKNMVDQMKNKGRLHQTRIRSAWDKQMGKTIVTYTTSIYLRKKTVYISISSAPLRNELTYSKDKIKEILNKELGEELIEKVVIR